MLSKDYSREFKEAFARRYSEWATITALVKEFGMTRSSVKLWRERIDQGGVDAIDRPSKNKTYSQEFKLEVVRAFLDGEGGYRELALKYGVRNSSQIRDWVNRYLEGGEGALVRHASGRRRKDDREETIEERCARLELENEILKRMAASAAELSATRRSTTSSRR